MHTSTFARARARAHTHTHTHIHTEWSEAVHEPQLQTAESRTETIRSWLRLFAA